MGAEPQPKRHREILGEQLSLIIGETTGLYSPFPGNANLRPLGSADATCVSDA